MPLGGDIGNYLALAVETLSRLVARLQKRELIAIQERYIEITNMKNLSALAGTACHTSI